MAMSIPFQGSVLRPQHSLLSQNTKSTEENPGDYTLSRALWMTLQINER